MFKGLALLCASLLSVSASHAQDLAVKYTGEIHSGYSMTSKVNGFELYKAAVALGTSHGVAIGEYGEVALGVDAIMLTHYYKNHDLRFGVYPNLNVRPKYPISEKAKVFFDTALGYYIPVTEEEQNYKGGKFMWHIGPGIQFKRLTLLVGFEQIGSGDGSVVPFGRLGIKLGKK